MPLVRRQRTQAGRVGRLCVVRTVILGHHKGAIGTAINGWRQVMRRGRDALELGAILAAGRPQRRPMRWVLFGVRSPGHHVATFRSSEATV
jgi:hypothetical protein